MAQQGVEGVKVNDLNIWFAQDGTGRPSGEAFVAFDTEKDAKAALVKDKEIVNGRWIELMLSTKVGASG